MYRHILIFLGVFANTKCYCFVPIDFLPLYFLAFKVTLTLNSMIFILGAVYFA